MRTVAAVVVTHSANTQSLLAAVAPAQEVNWLANLLIKPVLRAASW